MTATIAQLFGTNPVTTSRVKVEVDSGGTSGASDVFQTVVSGSGTTLLGTATSSVTDDAAATAFAKNTSNTLSTVGARLESWRNNGTERIGFGFSGNQIYTPTNGASINETHTREAITLSLVGTGTVSSTNLAPANSRIKAFLCRVTTTITGSTDWSVKVTGGNNFVGIGGATAAQTGLTANTTAILVPAAHADQYNASATTVTITTTGIALTGIIEIVPVVETFTAPTS
jgi:hypothetical protein